MKSILVPTDFSPNADLALDYAAVLAKSANAKILLLHCCSLYDTRLATYKDLMAAHNEAVVSEVRSKLDFRKELLVTKYGVEVIVGFYNSDDVKGAILREADDTKADLIVMGTYGATGLRRKLFGSKAAEIINESKVPVLTIPPVFNTAEPKQVLIAVDDDFDNPDLLRPVFEMADLFGASVQVVVFTEEEAEAFELLTHTQSIHFIEQKLKRTFANTQITVSHLVGTNFEDSIQKFITDKNMDLLVMITHKRGGLQNVFDRSLTQGMSYHVSVPLLSLNATGGR